MNRYLDASSYKVQVSAPSLSFLLRHVFVLCLQQLSFQIQHCFRIAIPSSSSASTCAVSSASGMLCFPIASTSRFPGRTHIAFSLDKARYSTSPLDSARNRRSKISSRYLLRQSAHPHGDDSRILVASRRIPGPRATKHWNARSKALCNRPRVPG